MIALLGAGLRATPLQRNGVGLRFLLGDHPSTSLRKSIETIADSLSGPQTQTFTYDELDRLLTSNVTGGTDGLYTEGYSYDSSTGNLASKNNVNYSAYDANHKHAVASLSNGNTYGYDQNGNMTSRHVLEGTEFKDYTLNYNAENQLVSVSGDATASFVYDGDGKQVKATVNGVTAVYVGQHYEVKSSVVSKYYFAGTTRLAVRTDGTLSFLLGDHLGSSSVTTNANGVKTASALYKAFGETRYTLGNLNTDYKFTGQREESALGGIYFFQSRWFDPSLGRFMSPDTIVPTSTQGTQAWDRYAFVNNNPVRYNDPTGHSGCSPDERDEGGCDEDESGSQDISSCTEYEGGSVECSIYIPDEDEQAMVNYFDTMAWGTLASYVVAGALIGALAGGGTPLSIVTAVVGAVVGGIVGVYEYSSIQGVKEEVVGAMNADQPVKITNVDIGVAVEGDGDGWSEVVNTPASFFTLDFMVWARTGNIMIPWP